MSNTLTSWKEIAQHLGKGVRTAQRWERELGLPVRRPQNKESGFVATSTEELDAWMRTAFERKPATEFSALRQELAEVKAENALLRAKIAALEKPEY